jgi:hypothetical protein
MQFNVTSTYVNAPGSYSINAGASTIRFVFDSNFVGTINGIAYAGPTDYSENFQAPYLEGTLNGMNYVVTSGGVRVHVYRGIGSN